MLKKPLVLTPPETPEILSLESPMSMEEPMELDEATPEEPNTKTNKTADASTQTGEMYTNVYSEDDDDVSIGSPQLPGSDDPMHSKVRIGPLILFHPD